MKALALWGCATRPPRPQKKKARAKMLLPLCINCHLRWVAKVQNLTCSIGCAQQYRRRLKERRNRRTR